MLFFQDLALTGVQLVHPLRLYEAVENLAGIILIRRRAA
jgi:hypothetical protein